MKLCSFKAERTTRVGVLMPDGKVADVNYAYAALLSSKGSVKPQQIADVITPANMIGLIENGEIGKDAIRESIAFLAANPSSRGQTANKFYISRMKSNLMRLFRTHPKSFPLLSTTSKNLKSPTNPRHRIPCILSGSHLCHGTL